MLTTKKCENQFKKLEDHRVSNLPSKLNIVFLQIRMGASDMILLVETLSALGYCH